MKKQIKLLFQKNVDRTFGKIINYVIFFSKSFSRGKLNKNPKKIVVFKLDSIGDGILTLSMIKHLKEKTKAKIIVACSKANFPVFNGQKFIDKIVVFDTKGKYFKSMLKNINILRKEKADVAIDTGQSSNISAIFSYLSSKRTIGFGKVKGSRNKVYDFLGERDSNKHMIENYVGLLSALEIKSPKEIKMVKLNYSEKDLEKVRKIVGNKKNLVGVHPCHEMVGKRWGQDNFARIIEFLSLKYNVVILGGPKESWAIKNLFKKIDKKYHKKIIVADKTSVGELIALIDQLKFFVGNDGGPMHIACSLDIPTIGLFKHENPTRYGTWLKNSISLYKRIEYNPCDKKHSNTKEKFHECVDETTIEDVKKAIGKIEKYA